MLITVFFNEELEAESRFHLINVIQFLPGEQFYSHVFIAFIARLEVFGDNLRLTSHMTVSGCFLIDRVTQFQTVFNGFRTKVEKLIDLSGYLAVAHIYMAAPVGIYIYIDGTRHTDGVRYLYQHFIRYTGSYQVLGNVTCSVCGAAVYLAGVHLYRRKYPQ